MKEVTVDTYKHEVYSTLPDFIEAQPHATSLFTIVKHLGDILIKHEMNEYFGVCLLHKHFPMVESEKLVEVVKSDLAKISPASNVDENSITPYMWKLEEISSAKYVWRPLEFVKNTSITSDQISFVRKLELNQPFLLEISEAVDKFGIQDIFGLSFTHRQKIKIDISQEVLLETDSDTDRTLMIRAMPKEQPKANEWTETFWQFDKSGNVIACTCCVCNP